MATGDAAMSDYAGWSKEMLEKEISTFAECRDACLRGDWGPDRRHLAEGYARRVDGLVMALNSLKPPPTGGSMTKRRWRLEWRYAQHSGAFTKWRVWATYATQESAEKAGRAHEERWKHALGQFRVIAPTDGTEVGSPKVRHPK